MYGLWLFKEIKTEYGYCKVEIYRKGYDSSQIEIGALAANSLTISLENLGEITAPIGKSVCSFAIIDTDQVDYDAFFTPDATAYKVVVSSKVENGAYITRWSGYVTPDFFAENLSYRTPISISARDNIGYLNDVDFDLVQSAITIRELITKAFARIASDYPMSLEFVSQKQTAEGILAIDATISTAILKEMSWYEALETVLHDLGLQMRWVDNNTIAVMDLSQIPEYYTTQEFDFIHSSGYREILPAWRQLSQSQDYGLRENFFDGWMRSDNLTFIKSVVIRPPNAINWTTDIACYAPNNWGVAREAFTIDPAYYGSKFNKKIYFSGVSTDYPTTTYLSWRQPIQVSDKPMQITFKAFNSVIYPSEKYTNISTPSGRRLEVYNPMNAVHGQKVGEYLQLGLKMNVLLHSGLDTYVLKNNWELTTNDGGDWQLNFSLPKVDITYVEGGEASGTEPREEEVTINIGTIPYSGDLELRIYGYYVIDKHNYWEDDYSVTDYTFDWEKCVTYINEPVYSFNTEDAETGQDGGTIISELHNVARKEEYTFGEIPENSGGSNAYAGGIVDTDGKEINGFQRNADGSNYNLLELVGREIIHFNKKNYNKLSGTIKNLDKEPLYFNKLFVREGKTYMPFSCSLNVISNEMNITTMQEVEPYVTESFTEIKSEVVSGGGAKVGGGNNTVLQYSAEAGNAKRIYELQSATTEETKVAEIIIDNVEWPEAKKLPLGDLTPLFKRINVGTEDNPQWAVIPVDYNGNPVGIVSDTFITSGGRKGSSGTGSSFNRLDSWDNYNPNAGDVLSAVLGYELKTRLDNLNVGLDESKLKEYLDTNEYITKTAGNELYAPLASFNELNTKFNDFLTGSDTNNIIDKWKELEAFLAGQTETSTLADLLAVKADKTALEAVTTSVITVEGYFTNGAAKNALKLGGQLPEYYATASALSTHISTYNTFVNNTYAAHISAYNTHIADYNTFKTDIRQRLTALEALWAIDEENNGLYPKSGRGIWSESYITAGGIGTSGEGSGGGGLVRNVYGYGDLGGTFSNTNLTDTFNAYTINYLYTEVEKLKSGSTGFSESAMWTALGGSAENKVIATTHIPDLSGKYLPLSGGEIRSTTSTNPFNINSSGSSVYMLFKGNDVQKASVGYYNSFAYVGIDTTGSTARIGVTDEGIPQYWTAYNGTKNDLLHSGNYNSYALPLTGGVLKASGGNNPLIVRSDGHDYVRIGFGVGTNGYASLVYSGGLDWKVTSEDWGSEATLIHSGNIGSQSVKAIDGYTQRDFARFANAIGAGTSYYRHVGYGTLAKGFPVNGGAVVAGKDNGLYSMLLHGRNGVFSFNTMENGTLTGWKTVAFTDSNVASASKLANKVKLWGNEFDGSADVTGSITLPNNVSINVIDTSGVSRSAFRLYSSNNLLIGQDIAKVGCNTYIYGNEIRLAYGTAGAISSNTALMVNSSGNVLVGTTTDNTRGKLQVDSLITATGSNKDIGIRVIGSSYELLFGIGNSNTNRGIYDYTNASWLLYRAASTNVLFPQGNILIGTSTDKGGKLQVNGGIYSLTGSSYFYGYGASTATSLSALDYATAIGAGKNNWNIYMWSYGSGSGCIQSSNSDDTTRYNLLLQPFGGNVGIGTNAPKYKLDVAGTFNAGATILTTLTTSGSATIGGTLRVTTNIRVGGDNIYNYISTRTTEGYNNLSIDSYGDKICISGQSNTVLNVNYTKTESGWAPKTWNWYNGSSTGWANFVLGGITANGEIILADSTGSSSTSYKLRFLRKTSTDNAYDFGLYAQTTKGLTFFRNLSGTDTDIAYLDNAGNFNATGGITATALTINGVGKVSGNLTTTNIYPDADASYNLGSTSKKWYQVHTQELHANSGRIYGDLRLQPKDENYGSRLYFGDGSYCYIAESADDTMTIYADSGLQITANTNVSGNIYATGEITAGTASDRRLKDNIQSMTDKQAVSVLRSLRPVTFNWNSTAYELGKHSGYSDGFIADEYEALIPNSGRSIWSHYRAINYERAISYVVKGWQNHETRLERLERENRELRVEVEQLKQYRRA